MGKKEGGFYWRHRKITLPLTAVVVGSAFLVPKGGEPVSQSNQSNETTAIATAAPKGNSSCKPFLGGSEFSCPRDIHIVVDKEIATIYKNSKKTERMQLDRTGAGNKKVDTCTVFVAKSNGKNTVTATCA